MCNILQLDGQKKKIKIFLLITIEMAVLSDFLQKKGRGPLGVKFFVHHSKYG